MKQEVLLIRHGKTLGNLGKKYIGAKTDEPLCKKGRMELTKWKNQGYYPTVDRIYSSPMKRCIQTAKLLYPSQPLVIVSGLKECDFGRFEGKSYEELKENSDYQAWLNSNGTLPFPGGEEQEKFRSRSCEAFLHILADLSGEQKCAIICHGGTIMAILEKFSLPHQSFYHWQVKNGLGYHLEFNNEKKTASKIITLEEYRAWKY